MVFTYHDPPPPPKPPPLNPPLKPLLPDPAEVRDGEDDNVAPMIRNPSPRSATRSAV